jgi:hypothetical protein
VRHAEYVPLDDELIRLLCDRVGRDSEIVLRDGKRLVARNIAWGYDDGAVSAHVTTNISPAGDGLTVDVFSTEDAVAVIDPVSGDRLYVR